MLRSRLDMPNLTLFFIRQSRVPPTTDHEGDRHELVLKKYDQQRFVLIDGRPHHARSMRVDFTASPTPFCPCFHFPLIVKSLAAAQHVYSRHL